MERRVYFILGDLLSCVAAGAAGGWLTELAHPGACFVLIGMAIGMVLGMVAGLLLSPFFGSLEVMLPASLSGMVVGMMHDISLMDAAGIGAAMGILCLAFSYRLQARLQGEVS
jgi:hypothetical protein